jgi:hypothetical protein
MKNSYITFLISIWKMYAVWFIIKNFSYIIKECPVWGTHVFLLDNEKIGWVLQCTRLHLIRTDECQMMTDDLS